MSNMRHFESIQENDVIIRSNGVSFYHGHNYPSVTYEDWHQLVYAQKGTLTVKTESGLWVVPPQRAVLVPSGLKSQISLHGAVTMSCLYFRGALFQGIFTDIHKCEVVFVRPVLCELVLHIVSIGLLRSSIDSERHLAMVVTDLLQSVVVEPLELLIPKNDRAKKIFDLLESEPDLSASLEQIAMMTGASRRTMERVIQKEMGISFGQWRQQIRMYLALRMLAEDVSVTNTALAVGYSTASAFVYAFRKLFGQSPGGFFK